MITNRKLHPKKYLVQPKCLHRLRNKLFYGVDKFFSGTVLCSSNRPDTVTAVKQRCCDVKCRDLASCGINRDR